MRAEERKRLYRTFGDTDPVSVRLQVRGDAGTSPVPDDAIVTLHIDTAPAATVIPGVPRGDDLGYYTFDTSGLATSVDGLSWEIQVVDDGVTFTLARGIFVEASEIA